MTGNGALSLTEHAHFLKTKEKMMEEETSGVGIVWEKPCQKLMLQKECKSSEPDETGEGEKIDAKDHLDELHSAMLTETVQRNHGAVLLLIF